MNTTIKQNYNGNKHNNKTKYNKRDHNKLTGHQTGPQQIDRTPNGTTANWQDTKRDHSKLAGHQTEPQQIGRTPNGTTINTTKQNAID